MKAVTHSSQTVVSPAKIFLILILLVSCKNSVPTTSYDLFPVEASVYGEELNWITCADGKNIQIYDSILVVNDEHNEYYLSFFGLNSHKLLGSFGRKGKGPGEFTSEPWLFKNSWSDGKGIYFKMVDQGKRMLYEVNLLECLKEQDLAITKSWKLPAKMPSKIVFQLNDSIWVGDYSDISHSLFFYDIGLDSIVRRQESISGDKNLPEEVNRSLIASNIQLTPNKQLIIGVFNFYRRIHLYNSKGDLVRIIKSIGKEVFDYSGGTYMRPSLKKLKRHFIDCFPSDSILLVIDARTDFTTDYPNTELLAFDYSGKPIAKFKLDRFTFGYAMDWKQKVFYAYDVFGEKFFSYDLSEILSRNE